MADYDLIVLGSGPAGEKGAAQAAFFGKRVAVLEPEPEPGGAAVHTGTVPSKTLRETALFLSGYRQRELYGLSVSLRPEHMAPRLLSRKDAVRRLEVTRIHENLARHGVDLLSGHGAFLDPHTVELRHQGTSRRLTADVFLIATGSIPHHPPDMDFSDPDIDDSDTVLMLDRLPRSLAILGAGVIGCEYATIFAALGVAVELIEPRTHILPFLDEEIGPRLLTAMRGLGVNTRLGEGWTRVDRDPIRGIVTTLASGAEVAAEQLLFTAGRSGNTARLGLDRADVRIGKRGYVEVDDCYRTNVAHIFAAGDCVGFPALASTSMEQGRVAVCHAFGFAYKRTMSEVLPYGIYTIPEVSCIGVTEAGAGERGMVPVVGRAFYAQNARGEIIGDRDGMVKLVFDRDTRRLVGCHCIGDRASELVHIGQVAMVLGGTVETLIELVFNYPTLSELYKYAAYDALGRWDGVP
ncbi:MAG TPA: Si-specific NAD(P)(+) transhydrogenase [Candidatus Binatia bacterium]|jgi:NAD(P) transhydrogenase|nr:Si-specific NAD(P)(+) transhydrogenase [Candidatus Binatia bacterium]